MELQVHRAEEITRLHQEIIGSLRTSLTKGIQIGELLAEQKESLKHGEFTSWIKENLPFTDRTARNYMRLHQRRDELKTETVSDLTGAYRLLTEPKKITAEQMTQLLMATPEGEEGIQARKRLMSYVDVMHLDEVKILLNKISKYRDFIPTEYPQKCHLRDLPDPCHHINDIEGCWRCQARTAVGLSRLNFLALERSNEKHTIK